MNNALSVGTHPPITWTFSRDALKLLPWLLIALSAPLFGVVTWNESNGAIGGPALIRLFGLPVLVVELLVIGIALKRGWSPIESCRSIPMPARTMLLLLIVIAFSTAAVAGPKPASALIWTYISLAHLLFGFAALHLLNSASADERRLIWPLIVAGLCGYALMLTVFVNLPHRRDFDWRYLGFGVSNVRQLGFYSVAGTAAAVGLAYGRRRWNRLPFILVGGFLLSISFWSGSRGGLLALAIGVVAAALLVPSLRSIRMSAVVSTVLVAGFALSFLQTSPNKHYGVDRIARSLQFTSPEQLSSKRLSLWLDTWNAFLERPLFGYGEAQVGWVVSAPQIYLHPHNFFLQLLFQWGIVGTFIVLALSLFAARPFVTGARTGQAETAPAVLVALSLVAFSLFDGALFHTYPLMMFAFSIAFVAAHRTCPVGSSGGNESLGSRREQLDG